MQLSSPNAVNWFRNSSPYINAHRNKTFVVAFPGQAVSEGHFYHLIQDIVLLHSLDIHLVLVHGARTQIDQRLADSADSSKLEQQRRVTSAEALPKVIEAVGHTAVTIQAHLVQAMAAAHLTGAKSQVTSGNFLLAKPYGIHNGVDYQHSGEIRKVHGDNIRQQLQNDALVLISPLGYSPTGELFNLIWQEVAEATAVALKADKLIFLTEGSGLLDAEGELIKELTAEQAKQQLQQSEVHNFTLSSAYNAVTQGVKRSHIIGLGEDGNLLKELFTVDGSGTLITQDTYEKVRLATIDDVASLLELIEPMEALGILVRRSRELLETEIDHFTLIERDEKIIACAALYPFAKDKCGELACVTVHPDYRKGQRGDVLLKAIEQRARMLGLTRLFVLTTRTAHWFLERGFVSAAIADLPQPKQSLYNYQRSSNVFVKLLAS